MFIKLFAWNDTHTKNWIAVLTFNIQLNDDDDDPDDVDGVDDAEEERDEQESK